jgi:transcriptional regulator with GAF, ATPase, and Fis domain
MPLELQPKLLRAIQDHEFERWAAIERSAQTSGLWPPPIAT